MTLEEANRTPQWTRLAPPPWIAESLGIARPQARGADTSIAENRLRRSNRPMVGLPPQSSASRSMTVTVASPTNLSSRNGNETITIPSTASEINAEGKVTVSGVQVSIGWEGRAHCLSGKPVRLNLPHTPTPIPRPPLQSFRPCRPTLSCPLPVPTGPKSESRLSSFPAMSRMIPIALSFQQLDGLCLSRSYRPSRKSGLIAQVGHSR